MTPGDATQSLLPVTPDFSRATLQANIESILRNSRDVHTHSLTRMIMDAIPRAAPQSDSDVVAALQALFDNYKELADSGDAGNWYLEDQPVGKQALAALENARHRISHSLPGDVGMREALAPFVAAFERIKPNVAMAVNLWPEAPIWTGDKPVLNVADFYRAHNAYYAALTPSALSGDAGESK